MSGITCFARRWVWLVPLALGLVWTMWCGYDGLTGADSNDYRWTAGQWREWLRGGPRPVAAEHPPGFALAGACLSAVIGDTHVAMRLLPILAFVLAGFTLRRILGGTGPSEPSALSGYVLLIFGASPFMLRYALVVLSDLPGLALMLLVYALLLKALASKGAVWHALSAVLAVCTLLFRYAVLPMLLAAAAYIVWSSVRSAWRKPLGILAVLFTIAGTLLVTFPSPFLTDHLGSTPLQYWSLLNVFRAEHRSDDGLLIYPFPNFLYVLSIAVHPGFIPTGVLLLPFLRWRDLSGSASGLAAAMLIAYLLFTAGLPFQNDRVMLLTVPFLAVLLFPAFMRAWSWRRERRLRPVWLMALLAVAQIGLFTRAMWPFIAQARMERELAQGVSNRHVRHVYTHALSPVLRNRCPDVEVTDLWYARIHRFEPGALVVVNEPNLREQWQGLPPWENWQRAQTQGVEHLEERPDGWVFARVR